MFRDGNQIKTYRIALGRNPLGAKQEEGDMKTPEGIYKIDGRNPQSSFHLALHISYPSDEDDKRAAAHGVSAGFDIMIHGIQNGRGWIGAFHRWKDWTAGCIAVTDEEIEELWRVTPDGTTIVPEATIFLKLLEHTSRFFDIRWPQNDQAFFRFATGAR